MLANQLHDPPIGKVVRSPQSSHVKMHQRLVTSNRRLHVHRFDIFMILTHTEPAMLSPVFHCTSASSTLTPLCVSMHPLSAALAYRYTFEVAPVFTMMEQVVLDKLQSVVGYEDGDGIFCPGNLNIAII